MSSCQLIGLAKSKRFKNNCTSNLEYPKVYFNKSVNIVVFLKIKGKIFLSHIYRKT